MNKNRKKASRFKSPKGIPLKPKKPFTWLDLIRAATAIGSFFKFLWDLFKDDK